MGRAFLSGPAMVEGFVCLIASLAYLTMATGHGYYTRCDGRQFYFARYIDWVLTTPLMLHSLVHFAGASDDTFIYMFFMDVLMIVAVSLPPLLTVVSSGSSSPLPSSPSSPSSTTSAGCAARWSTPASTILSSSGTTPPWPTSPPSLGSPTRSSGSSAKAPLSSRPTVRLSSTPFSTSSPRRFSACSSSTRSPSGPGPPVKSPSSSSGLPLPAPLFPTESRTNSSLTIVACCVYCVVLFTHHE